MADGTKIEWTEATWNPITGCSVVSPGCTHCYAMRLAGTRLKHTASRAGLTEMSKAGPVWNGQVRFNDAWLDQPLRWRRPRHIFVCAHGDIFHENLPDAAIDCIFSVMALAPQHIFQVLTKRASRMRAYFERDQLVEAWWEAGDRLYAGRDMPEPRADEIYLKAGAGETPIALPNVWLGVSVEDQARADERIPLLLATPAAVRFVSAEPLLGPVNLPLGGRCHGCGHLNRRDGLACEGCGRHEFADRLQWVIAGGESGPAARAMHPDWPRALRDQCHAAGIAFFFKQWGEWAPAPDGLNYDAARELAAGRARRFEHHSTGHTLIRVGKKAAGRLLDGREHSELPA